MYICYIYISLWTRSRRAPDKLPSPVRLLRFFQPFSDLVVESPGEHVGPGGDSDAQGEHRPVPGSTLVVVHDDTYVPRPVALGPKRRAQV